MAFLLLTLYFIATAATALSLPFSTTTSAAFPPPLQDDQFANFQPILQSLGFHHLSAAASATTLTGPSTIFAPTDASLRVCPSCIFTRLLQEHTVPGLFSLHYLRHLPFATKLETLIPHRCLTVTSNPNHTIFISGVEITHPDLFNNGLIIIHGIHGFLSHLSPFSCIPHPPQPSKFSIMRAMLNDAMLRLRITGFSVTALAIRIKYGELVNLSNMTVFALDDASIFSGGGHAFVTDVRFHIVPNTLLAAEDLENAAVGTVFPTLDNRENLVVTGAGGGENTLRINYVRIKSLDVMRNSKIVVHALYLPFPHLDTAGVRAVSGRSDGRMVKMAPTVSVESRAEIKEHHGV